MLPYEFTRLSDQVILLEPSPSAPKPPVNNGPTTVMLFTWGDGLIKHIAKYSDKYQSLYPGVRVVIVLSPISKAMFSTFAQRSRTMLVALRAALSSTTGQDLKDGKVLIHCFSNTGGINMLAMLNTYRQWVAGAPWAVQGMKGVPTPTSAVFPHKLLICDSTPGGHLYKANIWRWGHAMALGLTFLPLPFVLTKTICAGVLSVSHFINVRLWGYSIPEHSSRLLMDKRVSDVDATRLYMASKKDEIVWWEDIIANGKHAQEKGYDTRVKIFEKSAHVGHMRMYPDEYWAEVKSAWDAALGNEERKADLVVHTPGG
ncbi:hypothetical protein BT63DRAFT_453110 [Microthyrium microscopicum]|uniref:DUF829-domain-containing protein n=1 Tax=Microthyrium microscopicum TaxID=703497 RepID=A0A6A6UGF7_9PEZI|nr:hypothetical protein BT63DRAFT_453110 [Microthyrium microscopicum]